MPLGLAWMGVVWAEICVAVPWGLVVGVSCSMRCAVGIGLCQGYLIWWAYRERPRTSAFPKPERTRFRPQTPHSKKIL